MHCDFNDRVEGRIPASPPTINKLAADVKRCRWSVMIPVYNCAAFLPETLRTVLQQAPGQEQMQIEVIDDCSDDADVQEIVRTIGAGRISYFRQARNVGSLRNFLTCIERARGELIHLLHGDDCVRSGFYQKIDSLFSSYPHIGAAYSRYAYIDEKGKFLFNHEEERPTPGVLNDDWFERICERQRIQYAAMVVKREVYESLGGFYGVEYGEDWEMWVRISANYAVGYHPEVLAEYRKHAASISGRSALNGKNMADLNFVINKIQQQLPPEKQKAVIRRTRKFYAHYALRTANSIWKTIKNREGVKAQMMAAWKMHRDISLFYKSLKLYTKLILNL